MTMRLKLPALFVLQAVVATAQFAPGYVDPEPVLRAAEQAIGVANVKCITFSGTGYAGAVGQQKESGVNIDWPRFDALSSYTRTMNWDAKAMWRSSTASRA